MADIRDRESLEAWLRDQPEEVAVIIAARAALRVVPLAISILDQEPRAPGAAILFMSLRAAAAAWVAGAWPKATTEVGNASKSAGDALALAVRAIGGSTRGPLRAEFLAASSATRAATCAYLSLNANIDSVARVSSKAVEASDSAVSHYFTELTDGIVFREASYDASILKNHENIQNLAFSSLWFMNTPIINSSRWQSFLDVLPHKRFQHWNVWVDWYNDRFNGAAASRTVIKDLEIARVLIPNNDWKKGPAHVNNLIQRLEDEYRRIEDDEARDIAEAMVDLGDEIDEVDFEGPPELPPQSPAVIEVETREDGRLHRVSHSPPKTKSEAQANRLRSAWRALEQTLSDLERLNINAPGLPQVLASYRRALGGAFENVDAVELGFHGRRIEEYAQAADEYLLGAGKAELIALAANHGMVINQLPEWVDYIADLGGEPSEEANDAAVESADVLVERADLLADNVRDPLKEVADAARRPLSAGPEDRVSPHIKVATQRVIRNVLIGLLEEPMKLARDIYRSGRAGIVKGVGIGMGTWAAKEVVLTSDAVKALITAAPEHAWVLKAVEFIKMVFG